MAQNTKVHFIIDHLDPLGQGVFKNDDQIYFIPKTLPEESGEGTILKSKKGVNFCQLTHLEKVSAKRIESGCSHYNSCPGCHYLHCSYEDEIDFKLQSFQHLTKNLDFNGEIQSVTAPERLHYRNRIQLHYNLKTQKLGFIDGKNNKIVEVPRCQITSPALEPYLKELYQNKSWLKEARKFKNPKGHVEIYDSPSGIQVHWNKSYAEGGFTQVNESMNQKLQKLVTENLAKMKAKNILDLFSGKGNLSNPYHKQSACQRIGIDYFNEEFLPEGFYSLDLFSADALKKFKHQLQNSQFDTFIIDPPRKGFPNIQEWAKYYSPKNILYVSCHPQTMIRDIKAIAEQYTIKQLYLADLFPSSFHFETIAVLEKSI